MQWTTVAHLMPKHLSTACVPSGVHYHCMRLSILPCHYLDHTLCKTLCQFLSIGSSYRFSEGDLREEAV